MPQGGQIARDKIFYAVGSPHTWIEIPEVRDVSGLPNREREEIDTTVYSASSERSKIPGMSDVGNLEFTLRANLSAGSVHMLLKRYEGSQTTLWFRCEVSVGTDLSTTLYIAYTIQGRVKSWTLLTPVDGLKEIEVSILYEANLMFQEEMASVG